MKKDYINSFMNILSLQVANNLINLIQNQITNFQPINNNVINNNNQNNIYEKNNSSLSTYNTNKNNIFQLKKNHKIKGVSVEDKKNRIKEKINNERYEIIIKKKRQFKLISNNFRLRHSNINFNKNNIFSTEYNTIKKKLIRLQIIII